MFLETNRSWQYFPKQFFQTFYRHQVHCCTLYTFSPTQVFLACLSWPCQDFNIWVEAFNLIESPKANWSCHHTERAWLSASDKVVHWLDLAFHRSSLRSCPIRGWQPILAVPGITSFSRQCLQGTHKVERCHLLVLLEWRLVGMDLQQKQVSEASIWMPMAVWTGYVHWRYLQKMWFRKDS